MGAQRAKLEAVLAQALARRPPRDPLFALTGAQGNEDWMPEAWRGLAPDPADVPPELSQPPNEPAVLALAPHVRPVLPAYEDLNDLQREDAARHAAETAAREYSPLPDEAGWLVPLLSVAGDVGGAIVDTARGAMGDQEAASRQRERTLRWGQGSEQAGRDVLAEGGTGAILDALTGAVRGEGSGVHYEDNPSVLGRTAERVGDFARGVWMGWPESGRDARGRAAAANSDADFAAIDRVQRLNRGEQAFPEEERVARNAADRAAGDDFWTTGPAALEFVPEIGVLSSAAGGARRLATGAPHVAEDVVGPLTREGRGARNTALVGGGAYTAADAADHNFGDDPVASAIVSGAAMVGARRLLLPEAAAHGAEALAQQTARYTPDEFTEVFVEPDGRTVMKYQGGFQSGGGSGAEALRAMRGAESALREDIATHQRPEYHWTPGPDGAPDARLAEFYRNALRNHAPEGYRFSEDADGTMRLTREASADPLAEIAPQQASGTSDARSFESQARPDASHAGAQARPDGNAARQTVSGPGGSIEYEVTRDGWQIRSINLADGAKENGQGVELFQQLERQAQDAGATVRMGNRHARGSATLAAALGGAVGGGAYLASDQAEAADASHPGIDWAAPLAGATGVAALTALIASRLRSGPRAVAQEIGEDVGQGWRLTERPEGGVQLHSSAPGERLDFTDREQAMRYLAGHVDEGGDALSIPHGARAAARDEVYEQALDALGRMDSRELREMAETWEISPHQPTHDIREQIANRLAGDTEAQDAWHAAPSAPHSQAEYEATIRQSVDELYATDEFDAIAERWGVDPDATDARQQLTQEFLRSMPTATAGDELSAAAQSASTQFSALSPRQRADIGSQLGVDPSAPNFADQAGDVFTRPIHRDERLNGIAALAAGGAGGAAVGATMSNDAEASDGEEGGSAPLVPILAAGGIGALLGARGMRSEVGMSGRGGSRAASEAMRPEDIGDRIAVRRGLAESSVSDDPLAGVNQPIQETGNATGTSREPTEYARQSYTRLLEEAERLQAENGGLLPLGYRDTLSDLTGYETHSISRTLWQLRQGKLGPEIAERARAVVAERGGGPTNVNETFIRERISHPDLTSNSHAMLERLNGYRAELGLNPTNLNVVKVTMSNVRRAMRDAGELPEAAPRTPRAQGSGVDPGWRGSNARARLAPRPDPLANIAPERVRTDLPTTGYHATIANVDGPLIEGEGGLGRGAYHSQDPEIAEALIRGDDGLFPEGANIVPERLPALDRYVSADQFTNDAFNEAARRGVDPDNADAMLDVQRQLIERYKREGFVGLRNPDYAGGLGEMVTWDASNRRAPWARMLQRNRNSSDPLSAIAPLAVGGAGASLLFSGDEANAQEQDPRSADDALAQYGAESQYFGPHWHVVQPRGDIPSVRTLDVVDVQGEYAIMRDTVSGRVFYARVNREANGGDYMDAPGLSINVLGELEPTGGAETPNQEGPGNATAAGDGGVGLRSLASTIGGVAAGALTRRPMRGAIAAAAVSTGLDYAMGGRNAEPILNGMGAGALRASAPTGRLSPDFVARREAFAATLPDVAPTVRGTRVRGDDFLGSRGSIETDARTDVPWEGAGRSRVTVPGEELQEQGFTSDLASGSSPREQFLALSPDDQRWWMENSEARDAQVAGQLEDFRASRRAPAVEHSEDPVAALAAERGDSNTFPVGFYDPRTGEPLFGGGRQAPTRVRKPIDELTPAGQARRIGPASEQINAAKDMGVGEFPTGAAAMRAIRERAAGDAAFMEELRKRFPSIAAAILAGGAAASEVMHDDPLRELAPSP